MENHYLGPRSSIKKTKLPFLFLYGWWLNSCTNWGNGSLSHYLRRVSAPSRVVIAGFQPSLGITVSPECQKSKKRLETWMGTKDTMEVPIAKHKSHLVSHSSVRRWTQLLGPHKKSMDSYCWWLKSGVHQLRLVVCHIIYKVLAPSQVVV